ncbi:uncharacterized protein LOC130405973 isoform X2 [Gadus chalcogrammus]|uniref:uncharacterized protein LOC130405973 isoform X2 n=1 Tax=Gadus chalcogrammus TaxID=1042646 RepID=UPI0024C4DD7D|nr:uncharacterized protein LOC130405973 isoform X2 [Gadus chalcogrammus]
MLINMSPSGSTLEEQLSSIMEVLAKAAVSEISQLFSEGSASLRLQVTRSLKENETLRTRMKGMRSELLFLRLQTRSNASRAASRFGLARAHICQPRTKQLGNEDCDAFGDRSMQPGATSESLHVDAPGSSQMSSHMEELRILSVHGQGEGPLALDSHDTLFTASEVEALNSLSVDHSVATSLCAERLVRHEELSVQQTLDTISIKVEEDIGGGMPAVGKRIMLVKVKFRGIQKFISISEAKLIELLECAFQKFGISLSQLPNAKLFDDSKTEVDHEVFEEVIGANTGVYELSIDGVSEGFVSEAPAVGHSTPALSQEDSKTDSTVILSDESPQGKRSRPNRSDAHALVDEILCKKPGGDNVIREYDRTKMLSDSTRRKMVNILVAEMMEKHGKMPPRHIREMYAQGIIELFPYLRDPQTKHGYEHYYDSQSGQGYLSWRIKTVQRNNSHRKSPISIKTFDGGPTAQRQVAGTSQHSDEDCVNAISLMKHSVDEETVKQKMRSTFRYRRNMVEDPERCGDVLAEYPRFKDVKGLIEQDFVELFGEATSNTFKERWPTAFKDKIIAQSKGLHRTAELQELIDVAESSDHVNSDREDMGWDSDMSGILLLLYLFPPSAQGRKRPGKMAAAQAEKLLVVFQKTGTSIQQHLDSIEERRQPYLLATGTKKSRIHGYYIILDKQAIACQAVGAVGAFDELFKAHFVFGTSYNNALYKMYTFIQTTIFEIDIGKVRESPRVAEIRARLLHLISC